MRCPNSATRFRGLRPDTEPRWNPLLGGRPTPANFDRTSRLARVGLLRQLATTPAAVARTGMKSRRGLAEEYGCTGTPKLCRAPAQGLKCHDASADADPTTSCAFLRRMQDRQRRLVGSMLAPISSRWSPGTPDVEAPRRPDWPFRFERRPAATLMGPASGGSNRPPTRRQP